MFCDNNSQCSNFVSQTKHCGLSNDELKEFVRPLPAKDMDWERYIFRNGFEKHVLDIRS